MSVASFTENTAQATGKDPRTIRRSIKRVRDIGEDVARKIIGTSLASGVEMAALAKLPEPRARSVPAMRSHS